MKDITFIIIVKDNFEYIKYDCIYLLKIGHIYKSTPNSRKGQGFNKVIDGNRMSLKKGLSILDITIL